MGRPARADSASGRASAIRSELSERIVTALEGLRAQPPTGDIKRLAGEPPEWRLRVGDWRMRFTRDPDERVVVIQRVLPRGRAYRD